MESSVYENKVVDKIYFDLRKFSQCYFDVSAQMRIFYNGIKLAIRIDCFDQYQNFKFTYSVIASQEKVKKNVKIGEDVNLSSIQEKLINYLEGYDWKYLLDKNHVNVDYSYLINLPSYANKIKMYKVKSFIGNSFMHCNYNSQPAWCFITRETPKLYQGSIFIDGHETKFKTNKKSILQIIDYPFIVETDFKLIVQDHS